MHSLVMRLYTQYKKRCFCHFGNDSFCSPYINQLVGGNKIWIGNTCKIGNHAVLTYWGDKRDVGIKISNGARLGDYVHISALDYVEIGEGVLTGRNVTIIDNSHGSFSFNDLQTPPMKRILISKGPVVIQKNVWIGDKVTICPNVNIGEGAVVGANSVVTKNIPPFSMACGIPARIIKQINEKNE